MCAARAPAYFVGHGTALHTLDPLGGPFAALRAEGARGLRVPVVRAIVVLSAHWYAADAVVGVGAAAAPETVHDHPARHLYGFAYPAVGDPALAATVAALLRAAGFAARLEDRRGLDHGAWLALELLAPGGRLPVVPVALPALGADAATYLRFGAALAPLRDAGVALVCSGSATHNQDFFRATFVPLGLGLGGDDASVAARRAALEAAEAAVADTAPWSVAFDAWLAGALALPGAPRAAELARFAAAPGAALAHPEPSHLLPLLVFAGSGDAAPGAVAIGAAVAPAGAPDLGSPVQRVAGACADDDGGGAVRVAAGYQYGLSMSAFRLDR